jgi:hypothetical protein
MTDIYEQLFATISELNKMSQNNPLAHLENSKRKHEEIIEIIESEQESVSEESSEYNPEQPRKFGRVSESEKSAVDDYGTSPIIVSQHFAKVYDHPEEVEENKQDFAEWAAVFRNDQAIY